MKNYLNFEAEIKSLENELDKLKDPYNQGGLSEVDTNKISQTQEELDKAVKSAYVNEFTDRFEEGLDTLIGERGVKLSGGQRQRISIARALLADPKIIILMGSTAMEAVTGLNNKISSERGKWKEIILKNKTFPIIITFSPSYLLRFPENKKYSWEDLKKIRSKIQELNIEI